jgi:pantetheine-phosphate adenylyltransferase
VSLKEVLGNYTSTFITSPLGVSSNTPISNDQIKSDLTTDTRGYPTTALGGTFDHLHAAHKLLLHLSLFLTTQKLIVGIMTRHLLSTKSNAQLLESLDTRIRRVTEFLQRCGSDTQGVKLDVVEIMDPYGPTAWDEDIQALVVSRETYSGGEAVNKKRKGEGLGELDVWVIDVIAAEPEPEPEAESVGEGNSVESNGDVAGIAAGDGAEGHHNPVKTRDLSSETDEGKLKALKMGSTAIRQWIKDHPERE